MKNRLIKVMGLFILIISCFFNNGVVANSKSGSPTTTVSYDITLTLKDLNMNPVSDAKVVFINMNGDVIAVETSDKVGLIEKRLTVPVDKRYYWIDPNKIEPRGTVMVIVYKEGYREKVVFEVPVSSAISSQEIKLYPIIEGQRNELDVQFGYSHRHEIISIVEKYSRYLKER